MTGPIHPPAGGAGSYLVSFAAFDIGVFAYTAKPLVPVIELVFDSIASPTDNIDVVPSKWVAEDLYLQDRVVMQYPAGITSNSSMTDQPSNGVTKTIRDSMTPSDAFSYTIGNAWPPSGTGGTWDTGNADFSLSNSNLTATRTAATAAGAKLLHGTYSYPIAAGATDYAFTVHIVAGAVAIGLADTSGYFNDLGSNAHTVGVYDNGAIDYNSWTAGGNIGAFGVGDTVTVRVKNGHAYFSKDGGATWAGATNGANPATDTGGVDLSFMSSDVVAIIETYTVGDEVTGAF
jgi:hypothetical protein